ncbi:MAG TPA: hypothetical protein VLY20_07735 [Nitrospiria bacterium]|nr:hypothetical protein [Nitrospiria bacterium]
MKPDGNIAFKVTWVYGEKGPFATPCTPKGREHNIAEEKKVWCSQKTCDCYKLYSQGNKDRLDLNRNGWPCYDSAIFDKWGFGGGVYHNGPKKDQDIQIRYFKEGKLAFFTSRHHDMNEANRIIVGCFRIAGYQYDSDFDHKMLVAGDLKLRVKDFNQGPRYWKFHKQRGGPRWGTGLFRYIPDTEAQAMLKALEKVIQQ